VQDLERMAVFLCQGLGAREVYDSAGDNHSLSREKFFLLGDVRSLSRKLSAFSCGDLQFFG
ncbi:MAG: hypothetical protein WCD36_09860, partial [Rhodanobacteraceae bacterium]